MNSAENRERGFTLIEVLAAFLLTVFGLIAVFDIWNGAVARFELTAQQQRAAQIAESLLNEQRAIRSNSVTTQSGADGDFAWTMQRSIYSGQGVTPSNGWTPMQIEIQVNWTSRSGAQSLPMTAVILAPS